MCLFQHAPTAQSASTARPKTELPLISAENAAASETMNAVARKYPVEAQAVDDPPAKHM
jgi:hypothetical protein